MWRSKGSGGASSPHAFRTRAQRDQQRFGPHPADGLQTPAFLPLSLSITPHSSSKQPWLPSTPARGPSSPGPPASPGPSPAPPRTPCTTSCPRTPGPATPRARCEGGKWQGALGGVCSRCAARMTVCEVSGSMCARPSAAPAPRRAARDPPRRGPFPAAPPARSPPRLPPWIWAAGSWARPQGGPCWRPSRGAAAASRRRRRALSGLCARRNRASVARCPPRVSAQMSVSPAEIGRAHV